MNPLHPERLDLTQIKQSFAENRNILALLREATNSSTNEQLAIQISYDLQAGSYVRELEKPEFRKFKADVGLELAEVLDELEPSSVLEAGVGEATTLVEVARHLSARRPTAFSGFDLSWSRCHYARDYARKELPFELPLFVAGLESIPLVSDSVDLVYTAHAIEPNHGREREILRELYRVAQRYVVLSEPAYESADPAARARMDEHGYCRGLARIAEEEGWTIRTNRLVKHHVPMNPSFVLVIEKSAARRPAVSGFGCPLCQRALVASDGNWFCEADGVVFPTIRGIPCLLPRNAIIANKYLVDFPAPAASSR
jgi:uncharacterized protein YbaR (Trm112 family)